jgi:hypothetical protein
LNKLNKEKNGLKQLQQEGHVGEKNWVSTLNLLLLQKQIKDRGTGGNRTKPFVFAARVLLGTMLCRYLLVE